METYQLDLIDKIQPTGKDPKCYKAEGNKYEDLLYEEWHHHKKIKTLWKITGHCWEVSNHLATLSFSESTGKGRETWSDMVNCQIRQSRSIGDYLKPDGQTTLLGLRSEFYIQNSKVRKLDTYRKHLLGIWYLQINISCDNRIMAPAQISHSVIQSPERAMVMSVRARSVSALCTEHTGALRSAVTPGWCPVVLHLHLFTCCPSAVLAEEEQRWAHPFSSRRNSAESGGSLCRHRSDSQCFPLSEQEIRDWWCMRHLLECYNIDYIVTYKLGYTTS